jgi:hypothetical protein
MREERQNEGRGGSGGKFYRSQSWKCYLSFSYACISRPDANSVVPGKCALIVPTMKRLLGLVNSRCCFYYISHDFDDILLYNFPEVLCIVFQVVSQFGFDFMYDIK